MKTKVFGGQHVTNLHQWSLENTLPPLLLENCWSVHFFPPYIYLQTFFYSNNSITNNVEDDSENQNVRYERNGFAYQKPIVGRYFPQEYFLSLVWNQNDVTKLLQLNETFIDIYALEKVLKHCLNFQLWSDDKDNTWIAAHDTWIIDVKLLDPAELKI